MVEEATKRDVRAAYERIADHFSKTREYAWPEVESFVESTVHSNRALDIGCGNGRHAELLTATAHRVVAVDASRKLLNETRTRRSTVREQVGLVQGDASSLPLAEDCIDIALYVATLHHLPRRDDRIRSLDDLARVLTPDARALVSTWSTAHDKFQVPPEANGFDTTIDWTLPDGETVDRFYHIYSPDEFRRDIDASHLTLTDFEISSGNCYAVVRPEGKRP